MTTEQSVPEDTSPAEPSGRAEAVDLPSAVSIEGCTDESCSVADAVSYQHPSKGELVVVLYADYSESSSGDCMIAVLDPTGSTAQVLPVDYVSAWYQRDSDLTAVFHFMDPASDATGGLFFRSPDTDGVTADGLAPVSSAYFEMFDLSDVVEEVNPDYETDVGSDISWGSLDPNGNYTLEVGSRTGVWNGDTFEWDGES